MMIPLGILGGAYVAPVGGPELIVPDTLTGLRYWLNPDTLTGADGDPITTWASTVGEGVTQSDEAKKPAIVMDTGYRAARFDGTRFLQNSNVNGGLDVSQTILAVFRQTASSASDRFVVGVSMGTGVGLKVKSSIPRAGTWGGDWKEASTGINIGLNTWAAASMRYVKATSLEARTNAGSIVSTATTTSTTFDRRTQIGAVAGGSGAFIGDVREVVFYDRALTDEEWAGVHAYLMNKWSIA